MPQKWLAPSSAIPPSRPASQQCTAHNRTTVALSLVDPPWQQTGMAAQHFQHGTKVWVGSEVKAIERDLIGLIPAVLIGQNMGCGHSDGVTVTHGHRLVESDFSSGLDLHFLLFHIHHLFPNCTRSWREVRTSLILCSSFKL